MSFQDPIADMINRIKNAQAVNSQSVSFAASKLKSAICKVLLDEGYIENFSEEADGAKANITVELKYFEGKPVIAEFKRVSRPGLRRYESTSSIPIVQNGLGVAIVSTSHGVMSDRAARKQGIGGEVICFVS